MTYFFVFGFIGTLLLCLVYIPAYLLIFRKSRRAKLWHAVASAVLYGFGYSALIFLVEGEASSATDTTVSFAQNLRDGLPLYLVTFTFFSVFMTTAYITVSAILLSKDNKR
jgi:uncharacterized membrane protein